MPEEEKNKKAKLVLEEGFEIDITDEQAVLSSINHNSDVFILSEDMDREKKRTKLPTKKGFTFADIKRAIGKVFGREEK